MANTIVLYNPKSSCGNGENSAHQLDSLSFEKPLKYMDITSITSYIEFYAGLFNDDDVIVCGGDGTLNRYINDTKDMDIQNDVYYYACGTGNDFARDIGLSKNARPVLLKPYIKDLPVAIVKGKEYLFVNNVGFGIDGYCTKVGDEQIAKGKESINYAGIAIKGLLFGFRPVTATVTIDKETKIYKKCWLAPTLFGRFYGGGMMATPHQDRSNPDHKVSFMTFYGKSNFKTLIAFPSIFQGEHVKRKDMVDIRSGNYVHVKFNRPCPLQIDGETILNVTEYEVLSKDF